MPAATTIGGGLTIRGATKRRLLGTFDLGAPPLARRGQQRALGSVRQGQGATVQNETGAAAVAASTDLTEDT